MEPQILQKDERAGFGVGAGFLDFGAHAVREERDVSADRIALRGVNQGVIKQKKIEPFRQQVLVTITITRVRFSQSKTKENGNESVSTGREEARAGEESPVDEGFEFGGYGVEAVFGIGAAVGPAEVGHEYDALGVLVEGVADGVQGGHYALVVGDFSVLQGHVEVDAGNFF